jgi:hypothetical protein
MGFNQQPPGSCFMDAKKSQAVHNGDSKDTGSRWYASERIEVSIDAEMSYANHFASVFGKASNIVTFQSTLLEEVKPSNFS